MCRITKVRRYSQGRGKNNYVYYTYDLIWASGEKEVDVHSEYYLTFAEYRAKISENIQKTNKILTNQYKELEESNKLEADGKARFNIGV